MDFGITQGVPDIWTGVYLLAVCLMRLRTQQSVPPRSLRGPGRRTCHDRLGDPAGGLLRPTRDEANALADRPRRSRPVSDQIEVHNLRRSI